MRILHVVDFSMPHRQSGYSIRTHYIVTNQKKLGFDPIVLTREAGPAHGSHAFPAVEESLDGVTHLREPALSPGKDIVHRLERAPGFRELYPHGIRRRFRKHISRAVRKYAPDLIHAASPSTVALWSMDVGEQWGIPVIYEVRGIWHDTSVALGQLDASSETYRMRHRQFLDALARADGIVTLAETLKAEFIREGIPGEKIRIVPNGVDLTRFVPRGRPPHLAERLKIPPGEVVIGHIGAIRNLEGLHLLLEAADALRRRGLRFQVVIVGDGSELPGLKALSKERALEPIVHFEGQVPHSEILDYYGLIDIFVMPRTRSRVTEMVTPIKPYEAMAMERAVVVSDVAALREIVSDGETGLVCRADDAEDLAATCATLIGDSDLRGRLARRARRWAAEHRGWPKVVERYGAVYEEALRMKGRKEPIDPRREKRVVFWQAGTGAPSSGVEPLLPVLARKHEVHGLEGVPSQQAMARIVPEVVLVETFPFGPLDEADELLAVIEAAHAANPDVDVVCLLDGVPSPIDEAEARGQEICLALYAHFDAVLVLGDRQGAALEDRFPWSRDIVVPVVYLGCPDGMADRLSAYLAEL